MNSATKSILFGVITIVVSACSTAEAEPTAPIETIAPTVTATIESSGAAAARESLFYLNSIENNAVQVTAAFARIDEQLSKVWPTKSSLLDAFSDSELSQEINSSRSAVIQLLPPDEFEQEHLILQSTAKTVVEYSRQFEQALQDRDLVGVMVAKANFVVSYKRMLMTVSPRLCSALGIANDQEVVCDVTVAESGTYGAEVEQLFKEFRLEFLPRVTSFPLALTEEERFSALAALNKDIEFATQKAAKELAALSPPPARVADHNILLTYLEDTGETASAITIAGANQDGAKLEQLFAQSNTIFESAAAAISCDYNEMLLHGFFGDCASCTRQDTGLGWSYLPLAPACTVESQLHRNAPRTRRAKCKAEGVGWAYQLDISDVGMESYPPSNSPSVAGRAEAVPGQPSELRGARPGVGGG